LSIKQIIESIIDERKQEGKRITKKDIADYLGISGQNFTNKLARDTFSPEELSKIAEKLECELVFKGKVKEYKINY
jgi:DNA-binding Xre family transcriptional regulator